MSNLRLKKPLEASQNLYQYLLLAIKGAVLALTGQQLAIICLTQASVFCRLCVRPSNTCRLTQNNRALFRGLVRLLLPLGQGYEIAEIIHFWFRLRAGISNEMVAVISSRSHILAVRG